MRCVRCLVAPTSTLGLLVLAATGLGCGGDDDAPPPTGPIDARVDHYDYRIDLATRRASVVITATVVTAGDCLTLPFRGDDLGADVTINGAPAGGEVGGGQLTLCGDGYPAGTTLTLGASMTVPATTWGPTQVGFSTTTDRAGNDFVYLVSWVGGCDRHGACDNRPDQFARYRFTVDHPEALTVRCPGDVTEPSPTQTVCAFEHDGGPTYSTFGIVASSGWTTTDKGLWDGVATTVYDRTGSGVAARIDPVYHGGMMAFMSSTFGPYPYGDELRLLTGPTYWNGFEHPGNIVLSDALANPLSGSAYRDPVAHTLDHELAHLWAGDQTTLAGTYDFVWKEAMAEYLSYLHEDSVDPAVALATARAWKLFSRGVLAYPVPGERPPLVDYYGDVYGPGPMVLFRQLEVLSSRAQVIAALQALLGQARAIGVADVTAALASATGLDLTAYVAAWVTGEGPPVWPEFTAVFTPGATAGSPGSLQVDQTNAAATGDKRCRFKIGLEGADTAQNVKVVIDTVASGPSQTLVVPDPGFAVVRTVIDPDAECLAFPTASTLVRAPRPQPWVAPAR
ncbi:MAG: hypothetical protein KA297_07865 [Kofleriaceae bacterium]|nr:hypothetical protein [Kofleriaceae bacterium]